MPFLSFALKGLEQPLQRTVFNFQMSLPDENPAAIFRSFGKNNNNNNNFCLLLSLLNVMLWSKADEY